MKRETFFWLFFWLFLCVSFFVLLAAAEYTLRVMLPLKLPMYGPDTHSIANFISNLDRNRPIGNSDAVVNLKTNDIGVRDEKNIGFEQADIWVFGDSNIAALFLPFQDTIGETLERLYGDTITTMNFGVPGYGPDQSLGRFLDANNQATAKAVVFHIFADNDYGDLFRNNIYRFSDENVLVRENIERDPIFKLERFLLFKGLQRIGITPWVRTPEGYYHPLHRGKELPSNSKDELDSWVNISTEEYANYKTGMWTSWNGDHYDFGIAAHPKGEMAKSARKLISYILRTASNAYKGKKDCFVVLVQPSEIDIGGDSFVSRDTLENHYPDYDPQALVEIAIAAAEENDLPYIDLFQLYSADPKHYYFRQEEAGADNHWNAIGVSEAASLIHAHLEMHGCMAEN